MQLSELKALLANPETFAINRLPAHSDHRFYDSLENARAQGQSKFSVCLNGEWLFDYADNLDDADLDFFEMDYDHSHYSTINVPAHIQLCGYDKPHYVNTQYPWDGLEDIKPGQIPERYNPTASYVKYVDFPTHFHGKTIRLVFNGVETAFNLWVNGHYVGYSEDSFTPAEFDITPFVRHDKPNKIALQVYKFSSGSWLEDQDFWRLSGIFRDVYAYITPKTHIHDLEIQTPLFDNYQKATVTCQLKLDNPAGKLNAKLWFKGNLIAEHALDITQSEVCFDLDVANPHLWSDEAPNLYQLELCVFDGQTLIEAVVQNVGIREFKIIDKIMCLNGKRIVFRGVNRHEFSHTGGRTVSKEEMEWDVKFLKNHNFNAIRTSHYPNHSYIYELCDKYGLYVIDETNLETHGTFMELGEVKYSAHTIPDGHKEWKEAVLARAQAMLERDKNHPSIIIWSCGNEAYGGENFQIMHDYFRDRDPSRIVQYEGIFFDRRFNATSDVESRMYARVEAIEEYLANNPEKPFVHIEYAHAMGNSNGNMDEYTKLSETHPMYQGGFIWDYIDQALLTHDIYGNEYLAFGGDFGDQPTDYNFCVNGLIYADRRPSPKIQAVKGDFSPVKMTIENGVCTLWNKMMFTNLNAYQVQITTEVDGRVLNEDYLTLNCPAGERVTLPLNRDYAYQDELVITVSLRTKEAKDGIDENHEISFAQHIEQKPMVRVHTQEDFSIAVGGVNIGITGDNFSVLFAKNLGRIVSLKYDDIEYIHQPKQSLMPSFWRASTDNDRGNGSDSKMAQWKIASLYPTVEEHQFSKEKDHLKISFKHNLNTQPAAYVWVHYWVYSNGLIKVSMDYPGFSGLPEMYQFGMSMSINPEFMHLKWRGFGAEETYCDRLYGAKYGTYHNQVLDNFPEYVIPQECGNHSATRYFEVYNDFHQGIRISADEAFDFSALPWTAHELENAYHIHDLPEIYKTVLSINKLKMGIGGDDSWGAPVHEAYRIPADKAYQFTFFIEPIR